MGGGGASGSNGYQPLRRVTRDEGETRDGWAGLDLSEVRSSQAAAAHESLEKGVVDEAARRIGDRETTRWLAGIGPPTDSLPGRREMPPGRELSFCSPRSLLAFCVCGRAGVHPLVSMGSEVSHKQESGMSREQVSEMRPMCAAYGLGRES